MTRKQKESPVNVRFCWRYEDFFFFFVPLSPASELGQSFFEGGWLPPNTAPTA